MYKYKCDFCLQGFNEENNLSEIKIPIVCVYSDMQSMMVMKNIQIKPMKICSGCAQKIAHILEIFNITK